MSLKEQVLRILTERRGEAVSGQWLADQFHVSRAAVWKVIRALKEDGHFIQAGQNRGYTLLPNSDVLSVTAIAPLLLPPLRSELLTIVSQCSCTNDLARQLAIQSAPAGSSVLADTQTNGRGRQRRSFYSPPGGLYLSMLLRPSLSMQESTFLTIAAAVAVCRAVKKICNIPLEIKWVNDLFLNGKKVGGILTEAVTDLEGDTYEYAIDGIGLNIFFREAIPDELASIVTSLYDIEPDGAIRCQLTAAILNELYQLEQNPCSSLKEYRALNFVPGRKIQIISGIRTGTAKALSITDQGQLLVEYPDHTQITLNGGEIQIMDIV